MTTTLPTLRHLLDERDQNIVCRQYGAAHGYTGHRGGWIHYDGRNGRPARVITQGWGSFYSLYRAEILDWLTRQETAFGSFAALMNTARMYRPTIYRTNARTRWLADTYDTRMKRLGDPRRAYPEVTYS